MLNSICNRIFLTAFVKAIVAFVFAASSSGCLDAGRTADAAPASIATPADVDATIKKLDNETYQPELHDDFSKPDGAAPIAIEPVAAKHPVTIYGPTHCPPCNKSTKELNETGRYDACHEDNIPARVRKIADDWNQGAYPIAIFKDRKGDERFILWRGLKDFETRFNRTMKQPVKASQAASVAQSYLAFAGEMTHWSWPGDLRSHLVSNHGYSSAQVARMSDEEVKQAHDRAHEANGGGVFGWLFGQRRGKRLRGRP